MAAEEFDLALVRGGNALRICGVVYSLAWFRAMADRVGPGTHFDMVEHADGKLKVYQHKPGGGPVRAPGGGDAPAG